MSNNKKKTHEEYVAEVAIKNSYIEVVGTYINAKTPISHRCLIHNIIWMVSPTNVLSGKGCPECANENRANKNGISHEEYTKQLFSKNSNIEVIGKYVNARLPILHHCLIHDIYWNIAPYNALHKVIGCPECSKEQFKISRTKTEEEYIFELEIKNPNVELIGKYKGYNIPTEHCCKIHGEIFNTRPAEVLNGHGCKSCKSDKLRIKKLKTEDEYIVELEGKNPFVKLVGKYVDSLTPTEHLCLKHNIVWNPTPARVLSGSGCSQCGSEKISNYFLKSREQYIAELTAKNPNIELIGEYIGGKTPTEHYCKTHNEYFLTSPDSALRGCGCPQCRGSKGEKYISEWLQEHKIVYEAQKAFPDCRDKHPLLFDFYLPEYNCCIEYDGKQHFEPIEWFGGQKSLEYTQKHDATKTEYCNNNDIKLLRIPYFKSIEEELNNFLFI